LSDWVEDEFPISEPDENLTRWFSGKGFSKFIETLKSTRPNHEDTINRFRIAVETGVEYGVLARLYPEQTVAEVVAR
jgi:hypothetical protein